MGRKGVTAEDVRRAVVALSEKGASVSADAIRAYLGAGSKSTILAHMAKIAQAAPKSHDVEPPPEPLPDALLSALSKSAASWYSEARKELLDRVDVANLALDRRRRDLDEVEAESRAAQSKAEELEADNERLRLELVAAEAKLSALMTELRGAQQSLAAATGAAASERVRAEVSIADVRELRKLSGDELQLRIALERENAMLKAQLEACRAGSSPGPVAKGDRERVST